MNSSLPSINNVESLPIGCWKCMKMNLNFIEKSLWAMRLIFTLVATLISRMSHLGLGKPKNDYWKASLFATCNCFVRFLGRMDHWALFFWKSSWRGCFGEWPDCAIEPWLMNEIKIKWFFTIKTRIFLMNQNETSNWRTL